MRQIAMRKNETLNGILVFAYYELSGISVYILKHLRYGKVTDF